MIANIFWVDSRYVSDYGISGDVVCFDTTYQTNEYGRPFAPFVEVNHHKQTIVFGVACCTMKLQNHLSGYLRLSLKRCLESNQRQF